MNLVPFEIAALQIQTNLLRKCFSFSKPIWLLTFFFFFLPLCLYLKHFLCLTQNHSMSLWKSLAHLIILPSILFPSFLTHPVHQRRLQLAAGLYVALT